MFDLVFKSFDVFADNLLLLCVPRRSVRLYINVVLDFASDLEARDRLFRGVEVAVED